MDFQCDQPKVRRERVVAPSHLAEESGVSAALAL